MADAALKIVSGQARAGFFGLFRKPSARRHLDLMSLDWPGGRGQEIGTVRASLSQINKAILRNTGSKPVTMLSVTEVGLNSTMLLGLVRGPISFLSEPEMSKDMLAVIVGVALDPDDVWRALAPFLGNLKATRS